VLAAKARAEQLGDRQRRRRDALGLQADLAAATPEIVQLGSGPVALHAASQEQQAQVGRLEALRAVARQAEAEDADAAAARTRTAGLAGDLDLAHAEARDRQAVRPEAERARDDASRAAAALPAAQAKASAAREVAADSAALVLKHAERGTLREAHLTAREASLTAQAEALRLRGARIDGMRAELAASMTAGSPCPVCGSIDHPDPVDAASFPPVSKDEEESAFTLSSDAAHAADQAGSRVAAVEAVLSDLAQRLTDAGFAFPPSPPSPESPESPASPPEDLPEGGATPAFNGRAVNPAALAAAAQLAAADAGELEAEAARLGDAAALLTSLQRELDELDQAIAAGNARLVALTGQRDAALAEAEAAEARAAARRGELAARLGDAGDLETAISAATHLAAALTKAAGVADLLADPDLDVALDPPAPVEEATEAAEAAQHAHSAAVDANGQARLRADQLAALGPRLDAALDDLRPLRERAAQIRHLADLANGTGGANQYKMTLSSFVLAARLEEVAAAASERLLTMTAGRYSLVHSDARKGNAKAGLSLLACDSWTGIDRDTATLSGGETFLASLALALGLADVVTAESAGTRMEALFVDEGFGTLDEDTLDEVMNVLDSLRAGGRIVGIVSHVTELRQRVPAQVHVRKGRAGSHVEITPG
jgi:exonuclease SbcC